MTFTPVLYSSPGQVEALPVILLADHLGITLELKTLCDLPSKCSCTETETCLQVSENDCIKTTVSQLRYLARTSSSTLYSESDASISEVDARLDSYSKALTSLTELANHMRGTSKLDKKSEGDARKTLMNQLKEFDTLVKSTPDLAFNLSDVLLFTTLSCLPDANTQKAMKGMKGLKQRWTELGSDEKASSLLKGCASRIFA